MSGYIILGLVALLTVAVTVVLYIGEKKVPAIRDMAYGSKQLMIGVIFGLLSMMGTEFGIDIGGSMMNVRDAAPICAGLFFGGPAGIIAGAIGGIERWFAVYWGIGTYTRVACTVATICAGLFAALIRKFVMENKKAGWVYAMAVALVAEVLHMLLVFLTNTDDVWTAIGVVQQCAPIMISYNTISVGLAALILGIIAREKVIFNREKRRIVQDVQIWLLVSVVITFFLTNGFVMMINNSIAKSNAHSQMHQTLLDIESDINVADLTARSINRTLKVTVTNRHVGNAGVIFVCTQAGTIVGCSKNFADKIQDTTYGGIGKLRSFPEETLIERNIMGRDLVLEYKVVRNYYVVAAIPSEEAFKIRNATGYITAFLMIVMLAVLFIQIYFLISSVVVSNIRKINRDLARIASGNLDIVVDVKSNEEFASLSDDINTTVDALKHYIAEAEARIDQELEFAKNIQYSALPREYPDSRRFELYATMNAAKEVGGDFYDFYKTGKDTMAFLIADVSGKGIPAAMFMMESKTLIKGLVDSGADVATVFTKTNEELCKNNETGMFVTAWMGIMDLNTGVVKFANAGHNPPVIVRADGTVEFLKSRPGFVLAGMEGIRYRENEIVLEPGDGLFLYTDGVTEATDINEELYGDDRLIAALKDGIGLGMKGICSHIKGDVDAFAGEAPQFDDITMMSLRRKGNVADSTDIILVPDSQSLNFVNEYFESRIDELEIPIKQASKIGIIADEIYSNIVYYSGATLAKVDCTIEPDGRICCTFKDNGIEYNPLEKETPDTSLSADEREMGGLGIHMVREMTDDIEYERINGKNILRVYLK